MPAIRRFADGSNFKATAQIEYDNETERRAALSRLIGIEDRLFFRWKARTAVCDRRPGYGAQMMIGCDHPNCPCHLEELPQETLADLLRYLK